MPYENDPVKVMFDGKEYSVVFAAQQFSEAFDYKLKRQARGHEVKAEVMYVVIERPREIRRVDAL